MKLGLFMMPLHDPKGDYTKILQQDREAILLAEKLGYEEAWVGEHYSAATEPIADPLQSAPIGGAPVVAAEAPCFAGAIHNAARQVCVDNGLDVRPGPWRSPIGWRPRAGTSCSTAWRATAKRKTCARIWSEGAVSAWFTMEPTSAIRHRSQR